MATEEALKDKVSKGILWGSLNSGVQQLLNFVIGVFLARILTPADYGMVGVLAVFTGVAGALQEGGFIGAIINRKNLSELDCYSVFWFSLSIGVSCYFILFFCAPLIARFYDLPELVALSRVVFISLVISCLALVPRALLYKNLRQKELAKISMLSMLSSGIVGISLAFFGYAYWGLAWQSITYIFTGTVFSFVYSKWRPKFRFSFGPIRDMIGYTSKVLITNVFNTLNANIFAVLLGRFYSAGEVGDYNQANKWNSIAYGVIVGVINGVAHPALAKVVDDKARQVKVFRKLLRFTTFISFPLMLGLSLVARDFIVITIGEKWLTSALILQLLCIWGAFFPIGQLFSYLLLSQGRSKPYMWITISLACVQMVALYFSYPYGLFRMLYVFIGINIIWILVWYWSARKVSPLGFKDLLKDILPFLFIAGVSYGITYFLLGGVENMYFAFVTKILMMGGIYMLILWILNAKILRESIGYLREKIS